MYPDNDFTSVPKDSVPDGQHRRLYLKKRFLTSGMGSLDDPDVLELLLYYTIPANDTSETAKNLLKEFGSLASVLDAEPEQLETVPGIGRDSALFISLLKQLIKRYQIDSLRELPFIATGEDAREYLSAYFLGEKEEQFVVLLLDGCSALRKLSVIERGTTDSVAVNIGRVFKEALDYHAAGVILAHSHPNGFAKPSRDDIQTTLELSRRLDAIGVRLCEHIIFSRNDVCFMSREKQLIDSKIFAFSDLNAR